MLNTVTIKVLKSLYRSECVLKAAYLFVDKAYILVDEDDKYWLVNLHVKNDEDNLDELEGKFMNELLEQVVRINVYSQTKNIREMLIARAISTSIIDDRDKDALVAYDTIDENEFKNVLTDWFDKHEK